MSKYSNIVMVMILGCFFVFSANAEKNKEHLGNGKMHKEKFQEMKSDLNLTDDQAGKLKKILKEAREECGSPKEDKEAFHTCMKSNKSIIHSKLKSVLDKDQFEKFKKTKREKHQERMKK